MSAQPRAWTTGAADRLDKHLPDLTLRWLGLRPGIERARCNDLGKPPNPYDFT